VKEMWEFMSKRAAAKEQEMGLTTASQTCWVMFDDDDGFLDPQQRSKAAATNTAVFTAVKQRAKKRVISLRGSAGRRAKLLLIVSSLRRYVVRH
jgi:hypothetical protein